MDKLLPDDLFAPLHYYDNQAPFKSHTDLQPLRRKLSVYLPPAYANRRALANEVLGYINDFKTLRLFGGRSHASQKLLAVRCGLARYGRNNISYSKEFGSYMHSCSFFSDMPCDTDEWRPIGLMEVCQSCKAAMAACPTGAIHSGHHIDAIKCITASNELPGEFPEWLDKSAHNSIVGCMKCQDCCPANAHNKNNVKMGVEFSEEETAELLGHKEGLPLSDKLASKLEAAGIWKLINVLPRNLDILFQD